MINDNLLWLLFLIIQMSVAYASEDKGDNINIDEVSKETLFVSLGSWCGPAGYSGACGLRKAAFPLDWTVSMDGEKLIELIEDGFQHFIDDDFLVPDDYVIPFASGTTLLNVYYHIEFVHEGVWREEEYYKNLDSLKSKYQRRVDRFNKLGEYAGKVFFMRAAYIHSLTDPHRIYKIKENIEISREYSLRLYDALKKRFPRLNFCLIIINPTNELDIVDEERVSDGLIMIRAPTEDESVIMPAYSQFFHRLLKP